MSVTLNTQAMKYRETTADEWAPVTIQTEAEVNAVVQDTEPTGNENVWFDTSDESEVVVPTMDDFNQLNDKIAYSEITISSEWNYGVYPAGFTKTNCVIIGVMVYNAVNNLWYDDRGDYLTAILLGNDGPTVYVTQTPNSELIRVILAKLSS